LAQDLLFLALGLLIASLSDLAALLSPLDACVAAILLDGLSLAPLNAGER
jgi:hypothetical protein